MVSHFPINMLDDLICIVYKNKNSSVMLLRKKTDE
jgi:hypothetical protein